MEKIKKLFHRLKDAKIIFFLASLFFGLEYFILGPFSYVQINDNLNSAADKAIATCRALMAGGGIVYWLPYFSGGVDRLANLNGFNELANLFFVFPPWIASAAIIVIGVFLSGYFTFRLCHEILGFSKKVSVVAGILYSFAYVKSNISYTFGMDILPFVLLYLEKTFTSVKLPLLKKTTAFFVLGIIYSFFSSLVLTLPFTAAAIVIWFFVIRKQRSIYFYLVLIIFFLPVGLFKFQEAWSLLINTPLSQRGVGADYLKVDLKVYFNELRNQFRLSFTGVSLPALMAIPALLLAKKSRLFWQTFVLTFGLLLIMPMYLQFSATSAGALLGPFRYFDFSRFYLLVPFFSAILIGCVLESLRGYWGRVFSNEASQGFSFKVQTVGIVFCLAVVLFISLILKECHLKEWIKDGSYQANLYSADVAWLAALEKNSPPFRVAVISPQLNKSVNPSLANLNGLESVDFFTNIISRRQQVFFRLMAAGDQVVNALYFAGNLSSQEAENLAADFDPAKVANLPLLSLANTKYVITDSLMNSSAFELLPTPSAKNWQSWGKMSEIQKIKFKLAENFTGKKLLIYENKNYFSRFFLVNKIESFASEADLLAELATSTEKELRENVLLDKEDADKIGALGAGGGSIEILNYSADKIKLKVALNSPSILVISDNFSPFWEARVNGAKIKIIPADYAFMAIPLKEKNNEVELTYNPPYKFGNIGKGSEY